MGKRETADQRVRRLLAKELEPIIQMLQELVKTKVTTTVTQPPPPDNNSGTVIGGSTDPSGSDLTPG